MIPWFIQVMEGKESSDGEVATQSHPPTKEGIIQVPVSHVQHEAAERKNGKHFHSSPQPRTGAVGPQCGSQYGSERFLKRVDDAHKLCIFPGRAA